MSPRLIPAAQRQKVKIGTEVGGLTVIGEGEPIRKVVVKKTKTWLCECECGKLHTVTDSNLRSGNTTSCGCQLGRVHGESHSPVYKIWDGIKQRCENPNGSGYANYGGIGRRICSRYRESYVSFRDDLGPQPSEWHECDRKDNGGHYSCGQCEECLENGWPFNIRWATAKEQGRNKSNNRLVTYEGETLCVSEWAERHGMSAATLFARLKAGWSVHDAMTRPVDASHRTQAVRDKIRLSRHE